jgi:biotin carboxyl carrier protein
MEPVEVVVHADHIDVLERLIVAPAAGIFRPSLNGQATAGGPVATGQALGAIERLAGEVAVVSAHPGRLMGLLALCGERVRDGQPLAWVRVTDDATATAAAADGANGA